MASSAANAEKYDRAQRNIESALSRLAQKTGINVPSAVGKFQSIESRHALESDRLAGFLVQVADHLDPAGKSTAEERTKALGGIGDGYVDTEAKKKQVPKPAVAKAPKLTDKLPEPEPAKVPIATHRIPPAHPRK